MAEPDDWKTIEDWRLEHRSHEISLTSVDVGNWRLSLIDWGPKCEQRGGPFEGGRVAVLAQGAEWCRENEARNATERTERLMAAIR